MIESNDWKEINSLPYGRSEFVDKVFSKVLENSTEPLVGLLELKDEAVLSMLCDQSHLQDSFCFRCLWRARLIASSVIDDAGGIDNKNLNRLLSLFEEEGFIACPRGYSDGLFTQRVQKILGKLSNETSFQKLIKKFHKPLCHRHAEKLVRQSLGLSNGIALSDADIRRAALSGLLTVLRQNIGSCFATAPAILVHEENPELFLNDLYELLATGKLSRTFAGKQYAVPFSPTSGMGDLKKNIMQFGGQIWLSPGLIAAFEACGLIDPQLKLMQKIAHTKRLVVPFLKKDMNVHELIHQILLNHLGITDENMRKFKKMEKDAAIRSRQIGSLQLNSASSSLKSYYRMHDLETAAKEAFKGFADHALLKAWEFTLASFSEIKMEFSRWNLYSSLGFDPNHVGGIGEVIYRHLDEKLKQANQEAMEFQKEYEVAFEQVRGTEALLRQASSSSDAHRLQAEYQSRMHHMQSCLAVRDKAVTKAQHLASLFSFLIKQFDARFEEYFQELYDPEMLEVNVSQYDDCPAGFRLVYKHGRKDPSAWTFVEDAEQWLECLEAFFKSVEPAIENAYEWEPGKPEIGAITTVILSHLQSKIFFKSAMQRMQQKGKTPWAYTSGGTMPTLLQTYYRRENEITEEESQVESPMELAIFILDTLKNQPPSAIAPFYNQPEKGMLIHSPTHAFILHPGWEWVKAGWQDNGFTYTWIRDKILIPRQEFFQQIVLEVSQQQALLTRMEDILPIKPTISLRQEMTIGEFRHAVLAKNKQAAVLNAVDGFLHAAFPLISGDRWKDAVRQLLPEISSEKMEEVLKKIVDEPDDWLTAYELIEMAKCCVLLIKGSVGLNTDLHFLLTARARQAGLCAPEPFFFADSNWTNIYLAFTAHPATGQFELWRMDPIGMSGAPLSQWNEWLNGSKKGLWAIYPKVNEYS